MPGCSAFCRRVKPAKAGPWTGSRLVYEKVCTAWEPYGSLASRLPPELRERHAHIYAAAIQRAREQGWNPELGDED